MKLHKSSCSSLSAGGSQECRPRFVFLAATLVLRGGARAGAIDTAWRVAPPGAPQATVEQDVAALLAEEPAAAEAPAVGPPAAVEAAASAEERPTEEPAAAQEASGEFVARPWPTALVEVAPALVRGYSGAGDDEQSLGNLVASVLPGPPPPPARGWQGSPLCQGIESSSAQHRASHTHETPGGALVACGGHETLASATMLALLGSDFFVALWVCSRCLA